MTAPTWHELQQYYQNQNQIQNQAYQTYSNNVYQNMLGQNQYNTAPQQAIGGNMLGQSYQLQRDPTPDLQAKADFPLATTYQIEFNSVQKLVEAVEWLVTADIGKHVKAQPVQDWRTMWIGFERAIDAPIMKLALDLTMTLTG